MGLEESGLPAGFTGDEMSSASIGLRSPYLEMMPIKAGSRLETRLVRGFSALERRLSLLATTMVSLGFFNVSPISELSWWVRVLALEGDPPLTCCVIASPHAGEVAAGRSDLPGSMRVPSVTASSSLLRLGEDDSSLARETFDIGVEGAA
jgi:hypothetical protein